MKKIIAFFKKETVLTVAWLLALISAFFVTPSADYIDYIDFRSLGILWSLMVIMQGLKSNGVFKAIGMWLLKKTKRVWQLSAVLVFLCFFSSMFITNDVALITFVPFAILMLESAGRRELMIPVIVLQTIAANLGSMLTPIGNPQNLYLYGIAGLSMGEFILWMLPYTVASAVLLIISLVILPGKNDPVAISEEQDDEKGAYVPGFGSRRLRIICYSVLFILALLVVARVIPYYVVMAIVLGTVLLLEYRTLISVDYALLFTFVGFFIFTGNMGKIPSISDFLAGILKGREVIVGVLSSQCISNVPAALLLAGFTEDYKALLLGVNIGGLGTLIASMASLISYKAFAAAYNDEKGKYFRHFTLMNIIYLVLLLGLWLIW